MSDEIDHNFGALAYQKEFPFKEVPVMPQSNEVYWDEGVFPNVSNYFRNALAILQDQIDTLKNTVEALELRLKSLEEKPQILHDAWGGTMRVFVNGELVNAADYLNEREKR